MTFKLLPLCTHHISRKIVALLLGYSVWFYMHQELIKTATVSLPLYFLNADSIKLQAPEEVMCIVQGKQKFLKKHSDYNACVYVDAQTLPKEKTFLLALEKHQIHLPPQVSMIHCTPLIITVS